MNTHSEIQSDAAVLPETGCCPRFHPEPWQDKAIVWEKKLFLEDHVRSFLHVPLNARKVYEREFARIAAASAQEAEPIVLSEESSPWGADYYFAIAKPVPGAALVEFSGTFMTKVFEGPMRDAGRWAEAMKKDVEARGKRVDKLYFWYTTCPACAKVYGKNYVVLFAKVS